jgi:hypothetical protein
VGCIISTMTMSYNATYEVYTLDADRGAGKACNREKYIGFMYKVCACAQTPTKQMLCFPTHDHFLGGEYTCAFVMHML